MMDFWHFLYSSRNSSWLMQLGCSGCLYLPRRCPMTRPTDSSNALLGRSQLWTASLGLGLPAIGEEHGLNGKIEGGRGEKPALAVSV